MDDEPALISFSFPSLFSTVGVGQQHHHLHHHPALQQHHHSSSAVAAAAVSVGPGPGPVRASASVSGSGSLCVGCGSPIQDQYILRVAPDLEWHASCLKCVECGVFLDENCTCFVRDGKTFCRRDYVRYIMALKAVLYIEHNRPINRFNFRF